MHCLGSLYNDPSAFGGRKQKITWCFDRFVCNEHLWYDDLFGGEGSWTSTFWHIFIWVLLHHILAVYHSIFQKITDDRSKKRGIQTTYGFRTRGAQKTGILVCFSLAKRIITSTWRLLLLMVQNSGRTTTWEIMLKMPRRKQYGMNYRSLKWWVLPDFWTINGMNMSWIFV